MNRFIHTKGYWSESCRKIIRFVYIYKFIFYRFTIYLYKITHIFEKFGNFWVAILIKFVNFWVVILKKRQFLSFNSSKNREFWFTIRAKVGNCFYFCLYGGNSIFLEYLWCREYGGIRSLRVKSQNVKSLKNWKRK